MAAGDLKALEELRLTLMHALTKLNSQIMREKRNKNEDISAETSQADDAALPLHSEVEHSDQGKSTRTRRASGRRGS
jgi:hypothetical protein